MSSLPHDPITELLRAYLFTG